MVVERALLPVGAMLPNVLCTVTLHRLHLTLDVEDAKDFPTVNVIMTSNK